MSRRKIARVALGFCLAICLEPIIVAQVTVRFDTLDLLAQVPSLDLDPSPEPTPSPLPTSTPTPEPTPTPTPEPTPTPGAIKSESSAQ